MSLLEPVPIGTIAEAIRDQRWVDMRVVDVGTCERVLITQLKIAREQDSVVVQQKWEGADEEDLHTEEHEFDAEDIRWLRDTERSIDQVQPIRRLTPAQRTLGNLLQHNATRNVVNEIIRTVAYLTEGVSAADLCSGGRKTGCVRPRQEAMWLAYAMTDLSPVDICTKHFGYASGQPMLTISQKLQYASTQRAGVHYGENPFAWIERVRITMRLIDSNLGQMYRRQTASPGWPTYL